MENQREILAVSFGTSFPETREKTIGAIERHLAAEFPDMPVRRCFTSRMIRKKLQDRDGLHVDGPEEAIEAARARGVRMLVLQPLYLMHGKEHGGLLAAVEKQGVSASDDHDADSCFQMIIGKPLLTDGKDLRRMAEAIRLHLPPQQNTAVVLMGHGTPQDKTGSAYDPNTVYSSLQTCLREAGLQGHYIATVEGKPDLEDILPALRAGGYQRVILAPLMIVAGDHAVNDLAGDGEDSWKSIFLRNGFSVETALQGIGEWKEVQAMFADHAGAAMEAAVSGKD